MLKNSLKISTFALIMSFINFAFFHIPFFKFVCNNVDCKSLNGLLIVACLVIIMLVANYFVLHLIFSISRRFGKGLLIALFLVSSVAIYFVNTYGIILDETMIGNVLNTKYSEASGFFSFKLILYLIIFGILPSAYIYIAKIERETLKRFSINSSLSLLTIIILVFANAGNWLWIDKHSKTLGGLAMPWSYTVNICRFYIHKHQSNEKEILLPNATITNNKKAVVVLVIGESARRANFSLYGYQKQTNPLLSKVKNLYCFKANSSATYTTAGVKSILDHKETGDLYEVLPNYLYRNHVEVAWRTSNWGEPPLHIKNYQTRDSLMRLCKGEGCHFDEILLAGLKEQILASSSSKTFIVLHTSTSHGPQYSKRYPPKFETFKPVCNSVELSQCSHQELINAYDNTIVYTDYILDSVIETLKQLQGYDCAMIYVSDHGESLGEKNLYTHGVPISIAPKEQYEIPFIVWTSNGKMK